MTNTLADFSSKSPEQQKNPYHDIFAGNPDMFILKNVVEGKDEIINLLKDEIQYLRDQNIDKPTKSMLHIEGYFSHRRKQIKSEISLI